MKKIKMISLICCACIILTAFADHTATEYTIAYPEGFRKWNHIKTSVTGLKNTPQRKFDGFTNIYANEKAMEGYRTGQFPDGAIIVFDKHAIDTTNGNIRTGQRNFINIMEKNSKVFSETGGWGFENFNENSRTAGRLSSTSQQNCYNSCHASKKDTDHVISTYTE